MHACSFAYVHNFAIGRQDKHETVQSLQNITSHLLEGDLQGDVAWLRSAPFFTEPVWKQCSHLQVTGRQSNNAGFIHLSREGCRHRQQLCQLQKFLILPVAADTRCLLAFFLHYDFLRAGRASDRIVVQRIVIVRAQV